MTTHDPVDAALRYLGARELERDQPTCPRCGKRGAADYPGSRYGMCPPCQSDIRREEEAAADRERERKRRWAADNS